MWKSFVYLCILIQSCTVLRANEPTLNYLGIEQGLSNNYITSIYQDRSGFMWFGTYDGINRFDGYKFNYYKHQPGTLNSLPGNRITDILEDKSGNLWIATKTGVARMESSGQFTSLFLIHNNKRTLIENVINDLVTSKDGQMLAASEHTGLLKVSHTQNHVNSVIVPFIKRGIAHYSYNVKTMTKDIYGTIWLLIPGEGICLYDEEKGQVVLKSNKVTNAECFVADDQGNLWMGTRQGLLSFHIHDQTLKRYASLDGIDIHNVVSLYISAKKELWICSDGGGLIIYNPDKGVIKHLRKESTETSLTSNAVFAGYEDQEGRQWIGTLRGGINIVSNQSKKFSLFRQEWLDKRPNPQDFILSFGEDKEGLVWIGTDGEGIIQWNQFTRTFKKLNANNKKSTNLSSNYITRILMDSQGDTWVGTYGGGVNLWNKQKKLFQPIAITTGENQTFNQHIWELYEDSKNRIWATTLNSGGVFLLNPDRTSFDRVDIDVSNALTIYEETPDIFWFGTYAELIRVQWSSGEITRYTTGNAVRFIHPHHQSHQLWLGTEGSGLLVFDKKKGIQQQFTEAHGMPSNVMLNVLEDDAGDFWISTYHGLVRFNPKNGKILQTFMESDGLQSNQFSYNAAIRLRSGEFLFGGIKGFNAFQPERIRGTAPFPKVVFTDLKINNRPYQEYTTPEQTLNQANIATLTIPYEEALLFVEFAALEFGTPENINYRYILEGWDKDWIVAGKQRTAQYSRIQEGTYFLKIKSTSADGLWNEDETVIRIQVLPPWYRTGWAYATYLFLLASLIYGYIIYERRRIRLQHEVELEHLAIEQEKELNQRKLSFFTHISHEFRTPLTLITNPLKEIVYSQNKDIDTNELTTVYHNSKRLLSLVDQLLLFQKSDEDGARHLLVRLDMKTLCEEVFLCFKHHAEHRKISYIFESEDNIELIGDREKLEICLFNLISNALKFTKEGGAVKLRLSSSATGVHLEISDTGCGIPPEVGDQLFKRFYRDLKGNHKRVGGFGIGLYLVHKFVESHKGSIRYTSVLGQGTTFILDFKEGKQHFEGLLIQEDLGERSVFLEELLPDVPMAHNIADSQAIQKELNYVSQVISELPIMLIVDDEEPIRQYIRTLFERDFLVYDSGNVDEALQLIKQYEPAIVLSDVVMHEQSGIDLCQLIKNDPVLSHIPVILLTGSTANEVKLKGLEVGADDYITKPFDKKLLKARVSNILKSRNQLQTYFYNEVTLKGNETKISSEYSQFLSRCIGMVEEHLNNPDFNVKQLADSLGMSHSNLYKKVKSISGKSVNEFIRYIRLRKVAQLLINSDYNVSEAAFAAGFSDMKYFREQFQKLFGAKPSDYKRKYRGVFQKQFKFNNR